MAVYATEVFGVHNEFCGVQMYTVYVICQSLTSDRVRNNAKKYASFRRLFCSCQNFYRLFSKHQNNMSYVLSIGPGLS